MWTSSAVIRPQQAIEWYSHSTVWKWLPSWVITTGLSGGSNPGEEFPDWIPTPEVPAGDPRLDYVDAFTLLGGHYAPHLWAPEGAALAYDHVYYEG